MHQTGDFAEFANQITGKVNDVGVDVAMRTMLKKHGLEDKRDYTVVEAAFPTMRAMLAEKKVDLIPAVLPFSVDPELRKIARPLFNQREAIGVSSYWPKASSRIQASIVISLAVSIAGW